MPISMMTKREEHHDRTSAYATICATQEGALIKVPQASGRGAGADPCSDRVRLDLLHETP